MAGGLAPGESLRKMLSHCTQTHAVGAKASNQLKLFDVPGNVWEWCQDVSALSRVVAVWD
jgi:formylglycine-generating enzyme required for sulfatase activity